MARKGEIRGKPAGVPREDITLGEAERDLRGVIKSAKRVLEVFDFFAEQRRPLTVADVVTGLSYPQSSTSVLLKSLTRLGYLSYNRHTRLYIPTLRVALFGGWVCDALYSQLSLSSLIDDLHKRCGGKMVMIGMQNDMFVQYIQVTQSPREDFPWYIKPGSLRPLCRSGIGRVLLSKKSDVEVQQILWRINAEEKDPSLRMSLAELLYELNLVRAHGYAYTEGTVIARTGVVAVEMPTPPGQPPMGIGIGGPIEMLRAEREHWLSLLRETLEPYRVNEGTGKRYFGVDLTPAHRM